jgi:LPXTG-motif cell wall-anchored protein
MGMSARVSRSLSLAAAAVCGVGLGIGVAASTAAAAPNDPPGANGTIKIDAEPFDSDVNNEPHASCTFQVKLFGFDKDQHANLVFTVHPPSSAQGPGELALRVNDVLISDDNAGGARPDPDEVFTFTADQLDLSGATAHPKQGYHIKLTMENISGMPPGAGKHKVFWLQPCAAPTTPPPSPSESVPTSPSSPSSPGESTSPGGLPITGGSVGGMVAAGLGMVAAGTGAVLVVRRRRRLGEATDL